MPRREQTPKGIFWAQDGVSTVEFAILLPVLIFLMQAGIQLTMFVNATRKVGLVATSISEMLSQASPPSKTSTLATVNALDLHFSYDAAMVLFPYLLIDAARQQIQWWQNIEINYSSIKFTQINPNCGSAADKSSCYTANVVWTSTGTSGGNYRPCTIPQLPANDDAPFNRTTLPRSVFGSGSIIVVDVTYKFRPWIGASVLPAWSTSRSAYIQPRYASLINYDTTNSDGIATRCPGY